MTDQEFYIFWENIFTVVKSDGKDILGVWIRWVRRLYRILENDQDFRKKKNSPLYDPVLNDLNEGRDY